MVYKTLVQLCYIVQLLVVASYSTQDDTSPRIINGASTDVNYPYQVSLQMKYMLPYAPWRASGYGNNFRHFCGGTIIHPEYVLTTAHCVDRKDKTMMSVQAGVMDLSWTSGTRHKVVNYKVHEEYSPFGAHNIAILKVAPAFALDGVATAPINYITDTTMDSGVACVLSGWGSLDTFGFFYPKLMKTLQVQTISDSECQKYYSSVSKNEFCTQRGPLTGACTGDAGGPLTNAKRTMLMGIVSHGSILCADGRPDVHVKVSAYNDWIAAKMNEA